MLCRARVAIGVRLSDCERAEAREFKLCRLRTSILGSSTALSNHWNAINDGFGLKSMDYWFNTLATGTKLAPSSLRSLLDDGFIVIPGPVPPEHLPELADAYDHAVLHADPTDVGQGGSTTRVHDFVNRGAKFDSLYLHPPVLEACCRLIEQPFKLSSLLSRTLNPQTPPQKLHVDFPLDGAGWPMLGFIFMVDEFRPETGATCFLRRSHGVKDSPGASHELVHACGPAGSIIVYNGSTWHGHGANVTDRPRRSIQGAYIRRTRKPSVHLPARMQLATLNRINPLAKYLLAL